MQVDEVKALSGGDNTWCIDKGFTHATVRVKCNPIEKVEKPASVNKQEVETLLLRLII